MYIPDITERFPEGYDGVDMTPSYFGEPVDWSRAYQPEDDSEGSDQEDDAPATEPKKFQVGQAYEIVAFDGGITFYTVLQIDRDHGKMLLKDQWQNIDGYGTRGKAWHKLETQKNGNERCCRESLEDEGEAEWFYAY